MMPVQLAAFDALPKIAMSNASALLSTIKQIGTSVGLTIITSVMQHRNTLDYANLYGQVNAFNYNSMNLLNSIQGMLVQAGVTQSDSRGNAIGLIYSFVAKQASLQAINDTMLVISLICLFVILPTLLFKENKNVDRDENKTLILE